MGFWMLDAPKDAILQGRVGRTASDIITDKLQINRLKI